LDWYSNGSLAAGPATIQATISYSYGVEQLSSISYVPSLTWQANSFAEWTFPNPTFNGLLPGVTTSDEFKRIFGIQAANWSKTM
jgi:hypothetical protein